MCSRWRSAGRRKVVTGGDEGGVDQLCDGADRMTRPRPRRRGPPCPTEAVAAAPSQRRMTPVASSFSHYVARRWCSVGVVADRHGRRHAESRAQSRRARAFPVHRTAPVAGPITSTACSAGGPTTPRSAGLGGSGWLAVTVWTSPRETPGADGAHDRPPEGPPSLPTARERVGGATRRSGARRYRPGFTFSTRPAPSRWRT